MSGKKKSKSKGDMMDKAKFGPTTFGLESLIHIINELQEVFSTTGAAAVELPQIVVVGDQSSGKSSVLESLVRKSFLPRGTGTVTRCPTILQLRHTSTALNLDSTPVTEWCIFNHDPEKIYTDFEEVREEIIRRTNEIAGTNFGIVSTPIQLTVYSPNVVTLTVVDLPGIVRMPVGDQPDNIGGQIIDMIQEYIKNPNAIILAVSPANTDMATSESIKFAREVDPDGDRTLVIVTKLDLMDKGTDASNVLAGNVIQVKLGIIGVVNRSQADINNNKSVDVAIQDEAEFLRKNYPLVASKNGTPYLAKRLSQILVRHIQKCLPDLEVRIRRLTQEYEKKLKALGGANLPEDKGHTMLQLIGQFCYGFDAAIFGNTRKIEIKALNGGAKIREICQKIVHQYLDELPGCELTDEEIVTAVKNSKGFESTLDPHDAFQLLVKDMILQTNKPAMEAVNVVHKELKQIVQQCLTPEIERFPRFRAAIVEVVNDIWNETFREFQAELEKYISIESSCVNTDYEEFVKQYEELEKKVPSNGLAGGNSDSSIRYDEFGLPRVPATSVVGTIKPNSADHVKASGQWVRELVNIYFGIVVRNLKDHFRKSLAYHIICYATENMQIELTTQLFPDQVEELIQESEETAEERNKVTGMLDALKRATGIIEKTRTFMA